MNDLLNSGLIQPERSDEEKTHMKIGVLALMIGLMLAWPALAGTEDPCVDADTDSDGTVDICDNCDQVSNAAQYDGDQDGFGDACDGDYSASPNGVCDGVDFGQFATLFGKAPGPSCNNPLGTPCNGAICGNAPGFAPCRSSGSTPAQPADGAPSPTSSPRRWPSCCERSATPEGGVDSESRGVD